jgi:hypothetical protein
MDLLKNPKGFPVILAFSDISQNRIGKVMDWIYGSRDHDWVLVYGGLMTMGWRSRFGAREAVVIAQREREVHCSSHQWHQLEAELRR